MDFSAGSSALSKAFVATQLSKFVCVRFLDSPFFLAFAGYMIRAAREMKSLLQLLLAAIEFGSQGSADRPHIFSCCFAKGIAW